MSHVTENYGTSVTEHHFSPSLNQTPALSIDPHISRLVWPKFSEPLEAEPSVHTPS